MLRQLGALVAHNWNQSAAMQRAAQAQAQGLDPQAYASVFPGSTVTTNTTNTTTDSGGGYVKGSILAAALIAAGGGGVVGLGKVLTSAEPPAIATPAPKAAPAPAAKPGKFDAITEELQPDGTWKLIRRERNKYELLPDGTVKELPPAKE